MPENTILCFFLLVTFEYSKERQTFKEFYICVIDHFLFKALTIILLLVLVKRPTIQLPAILLMDLPFKYFFMQKVAENAVLFLKIWRCSAFSVLYHIKLNIFDQCTDKTGHLKT